MPLDSTKFKSLNEVKVYTHISENLNEDKLWVATHIEYLEIDTKYLIKKSTSLRCINNMIESGLLVKIAKGVYKLYENV